MELFLYINEKFVAVSMSTVVLYLAQNVKEQLAIFSLPKKGAAPKINRKPTKHAEKTLTFFFVIIIFFGDHFKKRRNWWFLGVETFFVLTFRFAKR